MTDESFVITNRRVLAIALPMTLAYLTTPLIGIVGTGVVGQFGDPVLLGGLAAGAVVFDVVFTSFNFLRSGTTGLMAQALGRGDAVEEQAIFWRAFLVALSVGLALVLLAPVIGALGERVIDPSPSVGAAMRSYIAIRMLAAPLTLLNYALLGYVLGRGEGGLGLLLQVVVNGVNVVLSLWLGLALGWKLEGVAWGAAGGELAGTLTGLAIILARFRRMPPIARSRVFDLAAIRRMVSINRDIMIRSFSLLAAFALFTRAGAHLGTLTLAANAILMNFFLVASYFLDGFATAAEQLAGRAVGARQAAAFRHVVRLTAIWGFMIAFAASALLLVFGERLIALITTAPDVRAYAGAYLPWAALTAVSGVLAFQMDGVFIGATWSRDMRNMMLVSLALYIACLFGFVRGFGNAGLWAALHMFLIARGLSLFAVLQRRVRTTFA